jgi:hypothetical protein
MRRFRTRGSHSAIRSYSRDSLSSIHWAYRVPEAAGSLPSTSCNAPNVRGPYVASFTHSQIMSEGMPLLVITSHAFDCHTQSGLLFCEKVSECVDSGTRF